METKKTKYQDDVDYDDHLKINESIFIFKRNGFSYGNNSDFDRIPHLTFSHRAITSQVRDDLNTKLQKFQEMILEKQNETTIWQNVKILQEFDWGCREIGDYFSEITELIRLLPESDNETFEKICIKVLQIKPIEADQWKFYTYKNKFFFFDKQTNSYYSTTWLPCSYCSWGTVDPQTNKAVIGTYCGCQNQEDD